jgi:SAM-dependent methyltransferase
MASASIRPPKPESMPARFNYPSLPGNPDSTQSKSALGVREGDFVLDLGCGTKRHRLALRQGIRQGIGPDLSPAMIEVACARLTQLAVQRSLGFQVGDGAEIANISANSSISPSALAHWNTCGKSVLWS